MKEIIEVTLSAIFKFFKVRVNHKNFMQDLISFSDSILKYHIISNFKYKFGKKKESVIFLV